MVSIDWTSWNGTSGAVTITAAKECHEYDVDTISSGYRLDKRGAEEIYDVERGKDGFRCQCWPFRKSGTCKHVRAIREIPTVSSSESKSHSAEEIVKALLEPFQVSEVKFKPAVVKGDRAMALAYVDARVVQDRLDEVLGIDGWQDSYKCLEDGSVVCRLRLKIGGQWVTKMDVGGPSEQPDSGDRMKAAFSDALKRAAVKFGVGRYLYRFPSQWLAYDPHKKQFTQQPKLPAFAVPNSQPKPEEKPQANPASDIKQSIAVEVKQSLDLADSLGRIQEVLSVPEAKSQPEQTRKELWAYALNVAYRKFGVRWEGGQWVPANGEVA